MTNRTRPSGEPGGVPSGSPTRIEPKDDAETTRGKMRENETAVIMARAGYNVEQRPSIAGDKEPDYAIEGRIFDCYAPITAKAYNIAETISGKVGQGQTDRIILNLDDSNVSFAELREHLASNPIPGLQEIIVVKDGNIIEFFP